MKIARFFYRKAMYANCKVLLLIYGVSWWICVKLYMKLKLYKKK